MGWGAPLGFSSGKTPFEMANTAIVGDTHFFMKLRALPSDEHPHRARVTFPCGRATFDSEADARAYLTSEQSDTVYAAAGMYLGWLQGRAEKERES